MSIIVSDSGTDSSKHVKIEKDIIKLNTLTQTHIQLNPETNTQ
jgi:hypothetical protein